MNTRPHHHWPIDLEAVELRAEAHEIARAAFERVNGHADGPTIARLLTDGSLAIVQGTAVALIQPGLWRLTTYRQN